MTQECNISALLKHHSKNVAYDDIVSEMKS